jgi:arsenate reductase
MIVYYGYDGCSTCRKAKAWLKAAGHTFKAIDITVTAPSKTVLQAILRAGCYQLGDLLNRAGALYRSMGMKARLHTLSEAEVLTLLARHGRLVKRPIVTDGTRHTVGFDEAKMQQVWS